MIYSPADTISMKAGRSRGMRVCNGVDMLVYQGARALELWTGRSVPVDTMRRAVVKSLEATS